MRIASSGVGGLGGRFGGHGGNGGIWRGDDEGGGGGEGCCGGVGRNGPPKRATSINRKSPRELKPQR